jgi:hypothetical protein
LIKRFVKKGCPLAGLMVPLMAIGQGQTEPTKKDGIYETAK